MRYIIKSCSSLVDSFYADGNEERNECCESVDDKKCADINNCVLKQIAENLLNVINSNACSTCSKCGYKDGCVNTTCGTWVAHKCVELLDIEEV